MKWKDNEKMAELFESNPNFVTNKPNSLSKIQIGKAMFKAPQPKVFPAGNYLFKVSNYVWCVKVR